MACLCFHRKSIDMMRALGYGPAFIMDVRNQIVLGIYFCFAPSQTFHGGLTA